MPSALLNDLVLLAGAVAELHAGGMLHAAGLGSPNILLPLWQEIMAWIAHASECTAQSGGGRRVAMQDAVVLGRSATELNGGVNGSSGAVFQIPRQVQHVLAMTNLDG